MNEELATVLESIKTAFDAGKYAEVITFCEKAALIDPNYAPAYYDHGLALCKLDHMEEAIELFDKSKSCDSNYLKAYHGLLNCYITTGKHDKAHAICKEMIEKFPDDPQAYKHSTKYKKYKDINDPDFEFLRGLLENQAVSEANKMEIYFSLGKAYDDVKEFDKAWKNLDQGNKLFNRDNPFKTKSFLESFAKANCSFFDQEFFEERKDWGNDSKTPIFVVGMPRSGTTLVEQILAKHSKVIGRGELEIAQAFANACQEKLGSSISYPGCLITSDRKFVRGMAKSYLENLTRNTGGAEYIVDKMPHNFWYLGLINLFFPNAKIVHCTREPMDVGLSLYFCRFTYENEYAYDLADIGFYQKLCDKMMDHWKQVLPATIYEISYEKLVSNMDEESRGLIDFCGIDWEDACLSPHKSTASVQTASLWQVRQPVYTSSVAKWKNYEKHLTPLKESLNEG